jgi:hypothetical protein
VNIKSKRWSFSSKLEDSFKKLIGSNLLNSSERKPLFENKDFDRLIEVDN